MFQHIQSGVLYPYFFPLRILPINFPHAHKITKITKSKAKTPQLRQFINLHLSDVLFNMIARTQSVAVGVMFNFCFNRLLQQPSRFRVKSRLILFTWLDISAPQSRLSQIKQYASLGCISPQSFLGMIIVIHMGCTHAFKLQSHAD